MKPDAIPKPAFGIFVEEMDGETLLYRLGAHKAVYLNETAALVWKLCDGSRTCEDIVKLLSAEYPEAVADIEADVMSAIDRLLSEGALLEGTTGS